MAKGSTLAKVGACAFYIGAILAVILALVNSTAGQVWVIGLLLVLGIVVGLLNISEREIVPFLIACVAFLVAAPAFGAAVGSVVSSFDWLNRVLAHLAVFVLPAALISALKAIAALASSR